MWLKVYIICLLTAAFFAASPAFAAKLQPQDSTDYLEAGDSIIIKATEFGTNNLRTYCYRGKPHSVLNLFETIELLLNIRNDDYIEYDGRTPQEVAEHYQEQRSLFSFTLFSQKRNQIQLSPFEQQCIGVLTSQPYRVTLKRMPFDLRLFVQLVAGIILFWSAARLAKNSAFYYLAGVVLGICASLLILITLISKLFPRRPMMYGVLIGGWTIGFYVLKQLMDNLRLIMLTYRNYVIWYLLITGLISFMVCYRIGPPKNPRSRHIINWVLQAIGGALVYFSSWHTNCAIAIMVITFVLYYFPISLLYYANTLYRRRFPTKRRLLTMEEYYQQSVNETARSLAELREHVNSPQCRQWNIIGRLHDPMRFATFANGAPHLYDEEIEDYSRTIEDSLEAAEEFDDDVLQAAMYYRPRSQRQNSERNRPNNSFQQNYLTDNYEEGESEDEYDLQQQQTER